MIGKSAKEILILIFTLCSLSLQASATMINFDTYRMLDKGMSEGEVIYRSGTLDKEIYFDDPAHRSFESIKQYFYIPLPSDQDPQLTIITFKKGNCDQPQESSSADPIKALTGRPDQHRDL